jgi:L-lysine 6-transaminase
MCAVDLPDTETRDRLMDKAYELGLMILGCGTRSIRFRPVLDVTKSEIDEALGLVRRALKMAYAASA